MVTLKKANRNFRRFSHAAVMGDIISSEKADSIEGLYKTFNRVITEANDEFAEYLVSPLTITLGDEFQGITATFSKGIAVMRQLRAGMMEAGVSCRFVVGLVKIETPINDGQAWNMMGPGLADTRARLADKRDPNAYRFSLSDDQTTETLMDAIGFSLSWIEQGWTDRQREVMLNWYRAASPQTLAHKLDHSLPTLYKVRRAANFDLYDRQWRALEAASKNIDRQLVNI